ncbi:phospholipid-transporting ATPase ABCA3-like isoform X2 [Dermacentor albipictus]|uniref:phospholipid-transporting ATPase ABCA3-like isoform X2 n=1 Tax=Dermacentor albipictus TaxID=60249 RepID=UPI0038FC44DD
MESPQLSDANEPSRARVRNALLSAKHLYIILWKNVYVKRLCRHYMATLVEIALIVALLLGIQEDSVVREPFVRKGNTFYQPMRTNAFWNTQRDLSYIREVYYFAAKNHYINRLTRDAFHRLGVVAVTEVPTERQLFDMHEKAIAENDTKAVSSVLLLYTSVTSNDTHLQPASLHVSFLAGRLPFDVQVNYRQRLLSQHEGPSAEERFPEMHTLLPIMGALQQRHLEMQAEIVGHKDPLKEVTLVRFPFPAHIELHDHKNYALVLTRFCIGMLVPFCLFVARLTDEKATGVKEMLRVVGVNDWVYWASHYLSSFFMHLIVVTLMLLFMCVKRNHEGRAFIQFSDPLLLFVILMFFCSQCQVHGMFLSLFFANPQSAVAGALLYWTCSCVVPFLILEHAGGLGYYYIARRNKLYTAIFPGMSLHWSFRVLERFEKFVPNGANWLNFYDRSATPDNVTLAEIVFVGFLFDCFLAILIWYLDNVISLGPGIPKSYLFPFKSSYWLPTMTVAPPPSRTAGELNNFEEGPMDQVVTIDLVHTCKDYDGVVAVDDVCLRIFDNQITVLLGHNGAGKSTLLNMITGFLPSSTGAVLVNGYNIMTCTGEARQSMGYCAQYNVLFEDLTVEEHVMFFAIVKGVPLSKARQEVFDLLQDSSLYTHRTVLAVDLSPGLQRRLCTALAIVGMPKVVILDEPTASMDSDGRRELWELLLKLRRTTCVLLTTQNLDEADVLGDRIAIMANGRIRCTGSSTFLKQRFGTGYRMQINKLPTKCNVPAVVELLRKYAPKARVQSDRANEAVFLLGQIITTKVIIGMFKDIEKRTKELGIESVGLTVTSLEDVLIRVGEDHHVHRRQRATQATEDDPSLMEARAPVMENMADTTSSEATLLARLRAVFTKRAIHVWREKRMPLFSWLLPPVLLWLLFLLEFWGLRGSMRDVQYVDDTLGYTFPEVVVFAVGFSQADKEEKFRERYLEPMFSNRRQYLIKDIGTDVDIAHGLLDYASGNFFNYVFNVHFGYQITKAAGTVLWYNGQIQHTALLITTAYNNARLRNVTGDDDATFSCDVTAPRPAKNETVVKLGVSSDESELIRSQKTYRVLLPKVLRSIFFPLVSSLMCSNFVLFPIAERALQVKHLHLLTGLSPALYWVLNFIFDFMFYMGTAIFVLIPLAFFEEGALSSTDISVIFVLNLLHGYAALPLIYITSFLFDNPGFGFTTLSILIFVVYSTSPDRMEYVIYPFDVHPYSAFYEVVTLSIEGAVLFALLILLEYYIAKIDQALSALEPEVYSGDFAPFSLKPATLPIIASPKRAKTFKDANLDVVEEERLVAALVKERTRGGDTKLAEEQAPVADAKSVSADGPAPLVRTRSATVSSANTQVPVADKRAAAAAGLAKAQAPVADTKRMLIVQRLHKTYGYFEPNPVLRGLSFTVAPGECFGLLGVNGVGKTTTFRILTGDILPHYGDAYMGPLSLVNNMREFQRYIGYCPQKDGLLDMLTGVETLVLFSRLKGVQLTQQYLDTLLDIFRLEETANQLVSTMSAGNRRKLSLCVSMIGMPPLLLLDEPYAGVSATARRRIVSCMGDLQRLAKISIVLTSHNLSDVEFLCNRIAILGEGKLQCLGSLAHLKEKFGKGYTILVKTLPDRKQDIMYQRDVSKAVTKSFSQAELVYTYEGVLEFRMSRVEIPWSEMFARMARIKKRFKLQDFYISDTSLEQLFLSVIRKEASEAAAAAAAEQQAPVVGHTMAATLGI